MTERKERKGKEHPISGGTPRSAQDKYTTYLNALQEGTQNYLVLKHLIQKKEITTIEAFFDYGITRLSGRIYELRHMGVEIETGKRIKKGASHHTWYAVYTLK